MSDKKDRDEQKKSDKKNQTKDFMGRKTGKAVERLRFSIGSKLKQEYHLTVSPSDHGGMVISWMVYDEDGETKTMSWDEGFMADYLCKDEILGFEISISEIIPEG